ncbi:hypothetical protein [Dyadobacter sp. Leaf189]|uniref:hypothetical protein n=1 Tax=Dyadobacter sp. Leaf189 TaxID=1736295 RepID=UPI00138F720D|nr:hypothetical protein [Dyadobacter sp. Leaf189]
MYTVTFNLSTSKPIGEQERYAETAEVYVDGLDAQNLKKVIHFAGKEGQWITESITFIAKKDKHGFNVFTPGLSNGTATFNLKTYVNILVGQNALKQWP